MRYRVIRSQGHERWCTRRPLWFDVGRYVEACLLWTAAGFAAIYCHIGGGRDDASITFALKGSPRSFVVTPSPTRIGIQRMARRLAHKLLAAQKGVQPHGRS